MNIKGIHGNTLMVEVDSLDDISKVDQVKLFYKCYSALYKYPYDVENERQFEVEDERQRNNIQEGNNKAADHTSAGNQASMPCP